MNPTHFYNIQIDHDIDQDTVTSHQAKLGNVKIKELTATDSIITKIEDRFPKHGKTGKIYSRYSDTDFMESKVNLSNCTVLAEARVGHLHAKCGTVFNGPMVVKGNIFLDNCTFKHALHIINVGKDTKFEIKNTSFTQIIIDPPKFSDEEDQENFEKFCKVLTQEKISYFITGNNNLNFACIDSNSNREFTMKCNFNASLMPNQKIQNMKDDCDGKLRSNVLELVSCSFEEVIFKDETGKVKLSGNCNSGKVTNGEVEHAANVLANPQIG